MKRSLFCASLLSCTLALAGCAVQPGQTASAEHNKSAKCCSDGAEAKAGGNAMACCSEAKTAGAEAKACCTEAKAGASATCTDSHGQVAASDPHGGEKCNTGQAKAMANGLSPAGTVNLYCVVNPKDALDAESATTEWKGEKVGFCCPGCIKKWDKMTDEQKTQKVAAAKAKNLEK